MINLNKAVLVISLVASIALPTVAEESGGFYAASLVAANIYLSGKRLQSCCCSSRHEWWCLLFLC